MRHFIQVGARVIEAELRGSGKQAVVIIPGMGCPMDDWTDIIDALADTCNVIAFHRAGCGGSDMNPSGPSVLNTVEDLNSLLDALGIQTPVILVGHSYGGLCVQRFARQYPDRVCGAVLVDSTSVDMERLEALVLPVLDEQQSDDDWLEECKQFASLRPEEILHQSDSLLTPHQQKFSPEVVDRITTFYTNPNLYKTMIQETAFWHQCVKETKESGPFPDVPLRVLARDPKHCIGLLVDDGVPEVEADLWEQTWHELIVDQSRLSEKGELITAQHATHSIYEDRPDLIIQTIHDLIMLCSAELGG